MSEEITLTAKENVIDVLLQVLEQGNDAHRCCAAVALGKIGGSRAVAPLMDHVQDPDLDVALDAIEALGDIGDPAPLPLLREGFALADAPEIKVNAITSIGQLGGEEVVPELIKALRVDFDMVDTSGWDASWDINRIAVESLGRIGDPRAIDDLASMLDDEEVVVDEGNILSALIGCKEPGMAVVIERLRGHPSARSRRRAALSLGAVNTDSIKEALAEALLDDNEDVRLYAARSLAGFQDTAYLLPMFMLLKDQHPEVRCEAIQLVALFGDTRAIGRILPLLSDDNNSVRIAAAKALGQLKSIESVIPLLDQLSSSNAELRAAAVVALGSIGDNRASTRLRTLLENTGEDDKVRALIPAALVAMADEEVIATLRKLVADDRRVVRSMTMMALRDIGTEAAEEVLIAALRGELLLAPDKNEELEDEVVESKDVVSETTAAQLTASKAAPSEESTEESVAQGPLSTLESMALDNTVSVDSASLGVDHEVEEELPDQVKEFVGLADENWQNIQSFKVKLPAPHLDVRCFAARALTSFSGVDVIDALCSCLDDADPGLQLDAINALGCIGDDRAFPDLLSKLGQNIDGQQFALTRALSTMHSPGLRELLLGKLEDKDHFVRLAAAEGLGQFQDNEVRMALRNQLIKDKELGVRLACARSLTSSNNVEDVDVLVQAAFLDEGEQRLEMGALLRNFFPERASEQFITVLNDPEQTYYHRVAIEALQQIYTPGV